MSIDYDALADDSSIDNSEVLYRRVPPDWYVTEEDRDGTQRQRPSSQAFSDSTKPPSPMSTFRAITLDNPEDAREGYGNHGVVALEVAFVRNGCAQKVAIDPDTDAPRGHTYVIGKKTGSVKSRMAKHATEILPPGRTDTP